MIFGRDRLAVNTKTKIAIFLLALVGVVACLIASFPVSRYVFAAYVFPGSSASVRGYPIIEPPDDYTGTWVDYSYTGRRLAVLQLSDGLENGEQVYFDDKGVPYYVGYIVRGQFDHLIVGRPAPRDVTIPFFFPQRWLNPSLRAQKHIDDDRTEPDN